MGLDNFHRDVKFIHNRYNSLVWLKECNVFCHDMHIDMVVFNLYRMMVT